MTISYNITHQCGNICPREEEHSCIKSVWLPPCTGLSPVDWCDLDCSLHSCRHCSNSACPNVPRLLFAAALDYSLLWRAIDQPKESLLWVDFKVEQICKRTMSSRSLKSKGDEGNDLFVPYHTILTGKSLKIEQQFVRSFRQEFSHRATEHPAFSFCWHLVFRGHSPCWQVLYVTVLLMYCYCMAV